MKKLILFFGFGLFALTACPQKNEQTFYEIIQVKKGIMFNDGSIQTTAPGVSSMTWNLLTGKPLTFPPAVHGHDWTEINNRPPEIQLKAAVEGLDYLPIPQKTTAEINAMVLPVDKIGLVGDKTTGAIKVWNKTRWNTLIINQ